MRPLLKEVDKISVPSIAEFVVAEHFKVDMSDGAEVKIPDLGEVFPRIFFGKIEKNVKSAILNIYGLEKNSSDTLILSQLGDRAETSLAHLFDVLKKGKITTNIVSYAIGIDGGLWTVSSNCSGGNLSLRVYSIKAQGEWVAGVNILSH